MDISWITPTVIISFMSAVLIPFVTVMVTLKGMKSKEAQDNKNNRLSMMNALSESQNNFRDDITKEISSLRVQNDSLRAKNEALIREIGTLQNKFSVLELQLTQKVALYESAHQDLPLPVWLKDSDGKMLALNQSYENVFLKPRGYTSADYLNKDDSAVWPPEIASEFRKNDLHVYNTGQQFMGVEKIPDAKGVESGWYVLKYVRHANGMKLGIAGIAFPINLTTKQGQQL